MAEKIIPEPISFWKFFWHCAKEAWSESREKFGLIVDISIPLTTIGLGVLAWYSRRHVSFNEQQGESGMSYWIVAIPSVLWALWFLYHVPKAAHKIYKVQFEKSRGETISLLEKINDLESKIDQFYHQTKPLSVSCLTKEMPNKIQVNCEIVLINQNPTQGIDGVELSLLAISSHLQYWADDSFSTAHLTHLEVINFEPFGMTDDFLTGQQAAYFPVFYVSEWDGQRVFVFYGKADGMSDSQWKLSNKFAISPKKQYRFKFEARARGVFKVVKEFKLVVAPPGQTPACTFEEIS